jgi:large subunit ribosomal protein L15
MKLHNLISNSGTTRKRIRVGRGRSNGRGKTSGRGHKGGRARSGYSIQPGFEGGQMPLFRKLPHRGFNNKNFRTEYQIINVSQLDKLSADGMVTAEVLLKAGLIDNLKVPVKVLANGEITKAVSLKVDKFSASAKAKIEAAGGTIVTE